MDCQVGPQSGPPSWRCNGSQCSSARKRMKASLVFCLFKLYNFSLHIFLKHILVLFLFPGNKWGESGTLILPAERLKECQKTALLEKTTKIKYIFMLLHWQLLWSIQSVLADTSSLGAVSLNLLKLLLHTLN